MRRWRRLPERPMRRGTILLSATVTEELGPRRNKKFMINKHGSGAAFKRKKKMVYNGGRRTLCPIQSDTKINYAASRLQGAEHRAQYIMWANPSSMGLCFLWPTHFTWPILEFQPTRYPRRIRDILAESAGPLWMGDCHTPLAHQ